MFWMVFVAGGAAGASAGSWGRRLLLLLRRGVRPPALWCEVGVAVLWSVLAAAVFSGALPWWWAPVPLGLGWLAVLLSACDVVARRLPDALTLPAYPLLWGLLAGAAHWGGPSGLLPGAVAGCVLHAGTYLLIRLVSARSMGAGDVKLSGTLGAVVGAVSVPAVMLSIVAAAVLTLLSAWRWQEDGVPHGPAMLAPAWLAAAFPTAIAGQPGMW
ncbi:hypothetical protein GCM10027563_08230 [Parasphingorhabdus pacifica]